jgi:hypothetical protein
MVGDSSCRACALPRCSPQPHTVHWPTAPRTYATLQATFKSRAIRVLTERLKSELEVVQVCHQYYKPYTLNLKP